MTEQQYREIERYMQDQMQDTAHDREHIYRVLNVAIEIAKQEKGVDYDILITACLLHDIGRQEQYDAPSRCHAQVGSQKAYAFLLSLGWSQERAAWVRDCIATHRFRKNTPPQTLEAKILFDADKVDVTGAIGIARTLLHQGNLGEPLYEVKADGTVDVEGQGGESFFKEYHRKLKHLGERFYTKRGEEIAQQRQKAAEDFYEALAREICQFRGK